MLVTGAGQIGMALARRTGFGKKIILGDKSMKNAETIAKTMNDAGYDVVPFEMVILKIICIGFFIHCSVLIEQ